MQKDKKVEKKIDPLHLRSLIVLPQDMKSYKMEE